MNRPVFNLFVAVVVPLLFAGPASQPTQAQAGPRSQPGTAMTIYAPEQHDLYDGRFVLEAGRIYQVGSLNDPPGWDHIGNDAEKRSPGQRRS